MRLENVDAIIKSATDSHVFGIETDNDIPGRYDSFLDPTEKLKAIQAVAQKAHAVGNKAFGYIVGLECITSHADQKQHTFFKDHPDWVQRKITGEPAFFGDGSAFWIQTGDEDVWVSPYATEWRKIYMERVRQVASTGIDGVYVDVPYWMTHFKGWENSWASFDDYTLAAFKARTGLNAKTDIKLGDYSDPGFLQWIDFRIESLTEFMKEVNANVKAANSQCMTIAEIYPGIEEEAARVGADVYQLYEVVDVIAHEYEYSSASPMAASKTPLHWFEYMTGMYSFRAFAEGKASWMLNYSWDGEKKVDPKEAMRNLFVAQLMAGTNVWDAKGHVMSGSNDIKTRKAVFKWIEAHEKTFYHPRIPIHPIGVYFSPQTRNYFPKEFMESYKGILALLLQSHLEFQIVTPRNCKSFKGEALIFPDVKCLSGLELDFIRSLIRSGESLIVTGDAGKYNERRQVQRENPVHRLLGIGEAGRPASKTSKLKFIYKPLCPGRAYFQEMEKEFNQLAVSGDYQEAPFNRLKEQFAKEVIAVLKNQPTVKIEASPFVSTQIAQVDGKVHVFLANFQGLKSKETAEQTPETNVRITFPAKSGARIYKLPYLGEVEEVKGKWSKGRMSCVIPEIKKGMVVWCEYP